MSLESRSPQEQKQLQDNFLYAVRTKKFDQAEKLLNEFRAIVVNAQDEDNRTAAYYAAFYGNMPFLHKLLESGANMNIIAFEGLLSPLDAAIVGKKYETASFLIDSMPKIDVSSLGKAMHHKNREGAILLVKNIAKMDISPEQYSKLIGDPESFINRMKSPVDPIEGAILLVKNIAKMDISPEQYSKLIGDPESFINRMKSPVDPIKSQPLMESVVLKILEKAYADGIIFSAEDRYVKAALSNAISYRQANIPKALLKLGVNANLYEEGTEELLSNSKAFIELSLQKGNVEMALYLLQHCKNAEFKVLCDHIATSISQDELSLSVIKQILHSEMPTNMSIASLKWLIVMKLCQYSDQNHISDEIPYEPNVLGAEATSHE